MSKTVNGEKWTYQYVGGKLLHETRGEKEFAYFYDANGFLSAIKYKLTPTGTEQTYYAAHNWRGDVTGLYNASGTRIASYEYDSWGKVTSIKGLSGNEVTSENHIGNLNKIRYRGYYQDTETGFYYLMSRYYDPVTHRFLNADGYFQTGTGVLDTNMSAYCANNPVNFLDPTGKYRECPTHGGFYSQPNCVGCRPDFQKALDRYAEIQRQKKKNKTSKFAGSTSSEQRVYITNDTEATSTSDFIYVVDFRTSKDPYFEVRNSYLVTQKEIQLEVVEILQNYNNQNPVDPAWSRTNESMVTEWDVHNIAYGRDFLPERAEHVSLNNKDEELYAIINLLFY